MAEASKAAEMNTPGLRELAAALHSGQTTAGKLIEQALERAHRSHSVFTAINPGLVSLAYAIDRARKKSQPLPPLAGIPIALKDLFNIRNELTLAGSVVRKRYAQPEAADADVVSPLRAAGLLFFGRTNMSEFAFSGIGKNPHYGTPLSIWDRSTQRLPGGSSSGSAVAVAEGIVAAALGSDTAGSCPHVSGIMDFASGAIGTITTSFDVWGSNTPHIEIFGTEGSLSVPDPNGFGGVPKIKRMGAKEWSDLPLSHGYAENSRGIGPADMAAAIAAGRPHRANGELAYHVLDIMHAVHDSSDQGLRIELESTCERPAPLPTGLLKGMLD